MQATLLKSEMVKQGLTQKSLAELIGIKDTTLSHKMTGKTSFTVAEAVQIMDALGLDEETAVQIFLN